MANFDLEVSGKLKSTTKGNADWYYGGGAEAWVDIASAKAGVPLAVRNGKTIGVLETNKIVEYIWHNDNLTDAGLVLKTASSSNAQILSGIINPVAGDGINGDFWINTVANTLFGPKTAGAWGTGISLVGPQGIQGAVGATGSQGVQGAVGAQGVAGVDGKSVLNGAVNPVSGDGVNGDFWINTSANTLFGPKTAGTWGTGISLVGTQGVQGVQGAVGATGVQGVQGTAGLDAPNNPETIVIPTVNGNSHNISVPITGYDNVVRVDLIANTNNINYLMLPDIVNSNYHVFAYLVQQGITNTSLRITGQAGWVYVNNISSTVDVNLTGITLFGGSTTIKYRTHQILIYVHKVNNITICEVKFISGNEY